MSFKNITNLNLYNKIVFIRTDMNVPIENGYIMDDTRIIASLNTINYCLNFGAKVIIATHLGRPIEGIVTKEDSVLPITQKLTELLKQEVPLITDLNQPINFKSTNIVMLENVRCNKGEKSNSKTLGKTYANLCDIFIHDAFATAHRAEASTDAIGYYAKEVCAGLLLERELKALNKAINNPKRPIVAIVGGSKISTKLAILENLADKVDYLIVGGGILNTFLLTQKYNLGKSLVEKDLVDKAQNIMQKMKSRNAVVPLPHKVIVAKEFDKSAIAINREVQDLANDDMIMDIGEEFAQELTQIITASGTIIWNGPLGVFEFDQFANGTKIVANSIAEAEGFSLAGGGDTIAAINKFNLYNKIDYISTAGGALLEYLEGKTLPALVLLSQRSK